MGFFGFGKDKGNEKIIDNCEAALLHLQSITKDSPQDAAYFMHRFKLMLKTVLELDDAELDHPINLGMKVTRRIERISQRWMATTSLGTTHTADMLARENPVDGAAMSFLSRFIYLIYLRETYRAGAERVGRVLFLYEAEVKNLCMAQEAFLVSVRDHIVV